MIHQLQIGQLTALRREALAPYDPRRAILFAHGKGNQPLAAALCEGVALQLLALHPIGQARLVLYEAVPSRQFAQIKRLFAETEGRLGEQLFNAKACNDLLLDLNELAHRRYALLAAADAPDIAAYNARSPRPELLTYLLIAGAEGLTGEGHLQQVMEALCHNGPAAGILPILLQGEVAQEEPVSDYRRKGLQAFWAGIRAGAFGLDLRQEPFIPLNQPAELWRLLRKFGVEIGLDVPLLARWADGLIGKTRAAEAKDPNTDFLRIPIGREGAKPAYFCLGEASNAYHVMLAGATRSGKSTLLNNLILQLCETFTPAELRLWLFDYKEGLEFNIFEGLAHLDALHADNDDKQYAIDAFARFEALMRERSVLFRQCNPPATRLVEYNRHAAQPLPRCLMIVDEAQSLFDDRESRPHAKRLLKEVSRKGAGFGLHILLSTQSYQNVDLETDVKAQFRLRLGLQLSSSMECRALMGRDNDTPLTLPRFTAVYNNNYGEARDNRIIALDGLPREALMQRLQALRQRYPAPVSTWTEAPPESAPPVKGLVKESGEFADWDDLLS